MISGCDASTNQINAPGSAFYDADLRDVEEPFRDAYVEVVARREGSGAVPYLPEGWFRSASDQSNRCFHQIWFAHKQPAADPQFNLPHNYFHVIPTGLYRDEQNNAQNGFTYTMSDASFVCTGSIEVQCALRPTPCNAVQSANHVQETTDHELAHQFNVNGCDNGGHDANDAWCGGSGGSCRHPTIGREYCIMHSYDRVYSLEMRIDGIARLDCDDLASKGANCNIPVCSGGISVRTNPDPE